MWPGCGPFSSPPLTDLHISNFGVVPVTLLGLNLVAQSFPQAEWAQLLLDARMHSGLWSHLLEQVVLQSVVYISATPVLCSRSSSPFCGCLLRGSRCSSWRVEVLRAYSTCRWWQFCLLVLPESKFVALCLLLTRAHVFSFKVQTPGPTRRPSCYSNSCGSLQALLFTSWIVVGVCVCLGRLFSGG